METMQKNQPSAPGVALVLALAALLTGAPFILHAQEDSSDSIRLTSEAGPVPGVLLDNPSGLCVYPGIPYAAAPIGPLRWRPPRKIAGWEKTEPAPNPACTPCRRRD